MDPAAKVVKTRKPRLAVVVFHANPIASPTEKPFVAAAKPVP